MAWMNGGQYPGMPFNQQMSCPYEFKLRKQGYGSYRIHALPIQEIEALRGTLRSWKDLELKPGENPLAGVSGELWDIAAEIEIGAAKEVGFRVRGRAVSYQVKPNAGGNSLSSADLTAQMGLRSGRIKLRVLVDRTTVEVFGNDGEVVIPTCFLPPDGNSALELFATGGVARVISLDLYPMQPAWRMA
jgi:sucrose-6-phosphate hydrolase SacC (GH32 family)